MRGPYSLNRTTENSDTSQIGQRDSLSSLKSDYQFEIIRELDDGTSIVLNFLVEEKHDIALAAILLSEMENEIILARYVTQVRQKCIKKQDVYLYPHKITSKMEQLLLTVVANHPFGVAMEFIKGNLNLANKTASAYVSSSNNWTSEYLYKDKKQVRTKSSVISFLQPKLENLSDFNAINDNAEDKT